MGAGPGPGLVGVAMDHGCRNVERKTVESFDGIVAPALSCGKPLIRGMTVSHLELYQHPPAETGESASPVWRLAGSRQMWWRK